MDKAAAADDVIMMITAYAYALHAHSPAGVRVWRRYLQSMFASYFKSYINFRENPTILDFRSQLDEPTMSIYNLDLNRIYANEF